MLPEAFLQRMEAQLGPEYGAFLESLQGPRAVALRFNPLKGEIPTVLSRTWEVPISKSAYFSSSPVLDGPGC